MNEHANILTPSKQPLPAGTAHDMEEPALQNEQQQVLPVQCSLTVGAVDDPLEHEADAMADTVMRMPMNESIQRKCDHCEEEEKVQRKPLASSITPFIQTKSNGEAGISTALTSRINNSRGSGTNMDDGTRTFMESRFGNDFSSVKIHTGSESVMMNRELNAKAFTVGNNIYFNEGQYDPSSDSGKHLLAHELTHTVQQGKQNSQVQRKMQVNPGLALDTQGFTTTKDGDVYTCPAVVKGSLWNEIFTSLLHSPRIFKVAGTTNAQVKKNFLKHMTARYDVVQFAAKKKYVFPQKATGEIMNPDFWEKDATGAFKEKTGVDRTTAVNDLNQNPQEYEIGCRLATKLTMEGGSKTSVLERDTGVSDDDWIPGDWGYIKNTNFSGRYGLAGENIIYTGKDLFWGHFGPGNTYKTLTEWFNDVKGWDGGAEIWKHRDRNKVGLE